MRAEETKHISCTSSLKVKKFNSIQLRDCAIIIRRGGLKNESYLAKT